MESKEWENKEEGERIKKMKIQQEKSLRN